MRVAAAVTALAAGLALAACAGPAGSAGSRSAGTPSPTPHRTSTTRAAPTATASPLAPGRPCGHPGRRVYRHVVWIWMENRSYEAVLGGTAPAPVLASYARRCGLATHYYAVSHPSLPNYLAAVSGSTGGVASDCDPASCPQSRPSLFGQIRDSGRQWRAYAEGMSGACDRISHDRYAARHNPAVYFTPVRRACAVWDRPLGGGTGAFARSLAAGTLPAFTFVTPDLCDDGHDCPTAVADAWLGGWLDRIVASAAYRAGSTAVFVTWDEGYGADNRVATVVVAPSVRRGTQAPATYTHYSLLRTTEELLRLPWLGRASSARSMRRAFGL